MENVPFCRQFICFLILTSSQWLSYKNLTATHASQFTVCLNGIMGFSFIEKLSKLENTESEWIHPNSKLLVNKHIYVPDWFKIIACYVIRMCCIVYSPVVRWCWQTVFSFPVSLYSRRAKRLVFNLAHRFIFIRQIIREFCINFGMPVAGSANNLITTMLPFLLLYTRENAFNFITLSHTVFVLYFIPTYYSCTQLRMLHPNFQIESWILVTHFKTYSHLVYRVTELLYHNFHNHWLRILCYRFHKPFGYIFSRAANWTEKRKRTRTWMWRSHIRVHGIVNICTPTM